MNKYYHILLLIGVLFIALLYPLHPTLKVKKRVVQVITVIITLFSGLRTWWMGDLIKYYTLYRNCNGSNWKSIITEKWSNMGIRVFFRIVGALGISYDVCIFAFAAFSAISLGIIIYRYSTSPFVSYLMYIGMGFYMFTFSGLKQSIAMGFLCFAMSNLLEGKFKWFVVWTAIGGFFHAPALVFLLAYPFANKKIDRWYLLFLAMGFALVFVFRNQIVALLSELYHDDADAYSMTSSRTVGGRFLMMLLILAVGYYLRPVRSRDATYAKVFNIMVLAALFQTFSVYDNVFTRLTDYFYQFIVVFMPMALRPRGELSVAKAQNETPGYYRHRDIYTIAVVAISVYAVYYYVGFINGSSVFLSDYKFFWQINPYSLYGS
jgi:hypothetical protein